jgi:hypothetical protein
MKRQRMELDPRCPYCSGTEDSEISLTCHFLQPAAAEHHDDGTYLEFGAACGCGENPWDAGLVATFCKTRGCLTLSCQRCNTWACTFAVREQGADYLKQHMPQEKQP